MSSKSRNILQASYSFTSTYLIPEYIDLKAEGVSYYVKWNMLHITMPNGTEYVIKPYFDARDDIDWKWPDNTTIELAEDHGISESDFDENIGEYVEETKKEEKKSGPSTESK